MSLACPDRDSLDNVNLSSADAFQDALPTQSDVQLFGDLYVAPIVAEAIVMVVKIQGEFSLISHISGPYCVLTCALIQVSILPTRWC